jgi:iron complex transport system ATP-binding protein
VRTPLTVFILAGGQSSRMGRDKSRLLLGSKSFLQRIVTTARELDAPVEVVTNDDTPGLGPIGGVMTALNRGECRKALFLSCDMPLISADVLRRLAASDSAFSFVNGRAGFPFIVPRSIVPRLKQVHSIQELSEATKAKRFVPSPEEAWQFENVNTPADYRRVLKIWSERHRSDAVLEVRHLTVRRGTTPMVSDVSWKVRKGEHWAVLGPNGCGKTSLFSALLGYLTPTKGDIFVMGEEYGDSDWPELRKRIGMVSSSVRQMMPETEPAWITVASGKYAMIDYWGTPAKRDKAEAMQLLRQSECDHLADRPWGVLSQGERQRVLIARALMPKPALLILDEPCAGLDPAAREKFLAFLERLGRTPQAPNIVLVTHHVEEIMPVFTHLMLLKAGKAIATGTVKSILTSHWLTRTFDTSMSVRKTGRRYELKVSASLPIG